MASTNKTSFGLTQYALDDIPDLSDTNGDNRIINEELLKRAEKDTDGKVAKAIAADMAGTSNYAKDAVADDALDQRLKVTEEQANKYDAAAQKRYWHCRTPPPVKMAGLRYRRTTRKKQTKWLNQ